MMKHLICLCVLVWAFSSLSAQYTYTIKADSVKITNCDSSELIIENHTQNVPGFLFNTGKGRTIFKRGALKLNDSLYLVGADTIKTQPKAWIQGGNGFGTTGILGTTDNNHLDLYTNNAQRVRLTNSGNLLIGGTTDNGQKLQVNGKLSVSDSSFLAGLIVTSNAATHIIRGDAGKGIMIGGNGVNNNAPGSMYNIDSGSLIIDVPQSPIGGLSGRISNSVVIGGTSGALNATMSNSLVVARDINSDPIYNSLTRSNLTTFGGSYGFLRDDNPGGAAYLLNNYKGNIYLGFDPGNWVTGSIPSNYIQIGGSGHNFLGLFGGFHVTPPLQSTLAGPSFGVIGFPPNLSFGPTGFFRVAAGRGTGNGSGSDLRFAVAPPRDSGTALNPYVDAVTISGSTANVGIGTTSPTAQLHTTGTVRFAGLTSDTTKTRVLVSDVNGNLFYRDASTLAANEPIRSSLAVNGPITAQKLTLSARDWPDYVFNSAYRLLPLSHLEEYIQQHNHLPGIPSAAAVEKHGTDVGETQAALLKKIEELTLYTIDQDKKSSDQEKKLKDQDAEIDYLKKRMEKLEQIIDTIAKKESEE